MRRLFFALLIMMMTMVTANAQTLTERQLGLAACACLMAQGDMNRLEPAVRTALDNGVTINELKEAFSQLYAYTGFPRSLNALGVLNMVLEASPRGGSLDTPRRMGRCQEGLRTGYQEPDAALRKALQLRVLPAG